MNRCIAIVAAVATTRAFHLPAATLHRARPRASAAVSSEVFTHAIAHPFGEKDGDVEAPKLKWLLGGKGANLGVMSALGLSIPSGFTLTTEVCAAYHDNGSELPADVWAATLASLKDVEAKMGCSLGDPKAPLLLSVRSGAAVSMPGMMDTVLNLGLNDKVAVGLAELSGNERYAYDCYRRFLDMFGDVVMGISHSLFEEELMNLKADRGVWEDADLTGADLKELVEKYKQVYVRAGKEFPEEPLEQLKYSIRAVFDSWQSDRAIKYMEYNGIVGLLGTAVNVQAMAFGNMGETSGTGVCFTRNPSTGERKLYGEYLINAQGEDVVAGIRTPEPIAQLADAMPAVYDEFVRNCDLLENHFSDMQDIEFTVQQGKLFMLQTRSGKRTGAAAVRVAVELEKEGFVDRDTAVSMVEADHLDQLLHPQFTDTESAAYLAGVVATGLPASPGAAVGTLVFSAEEAEAANKRGESVLLVRDETSPEDVAGMFNAAGIMTCRGGMTSHAAVVARGWGKPCVCGSQALEIDEEAKTLTVNGKTWVEGDSMSINGNTGEVLDGEQALAPPAMSADLAKFMEWVDAARTLKVLANADTPADAKAARENGAQGIGLIRTEHMFFEPARIAIVRKMILAGTPELKAEAIAALLPYQRSDFEGIFEAMDGCKVTVRLLDPPQHEFLPERASEELASSAGISLDACAAKLEALREANPMLGLRGCRLGITSPEIVEMQATAVFEAAVAAAAKGVDVQPDMMVPLVGTVAEFTHQADIIRRVAAAVFAKAGREVPYRVGTMIEIPRAALMAKEIAESGAEFFSFGSNDLTQMTLGYSRDDAGSFLPTYLEEGILPADPFQTLDTEGVGQLIKMATANGRAAREGLTVGVCGEHGGDPESIVFFDDVGLDYVSCSPLRVPVARLAAAQAAIARKGL